MRRIYEIQQDKDHKANQPDSLESLRAELAKRDGEFGATYSGSSRSILRNLLMRALAALEAAEQRRKKLYEQYEEMYAKNDRLGAQVTALREALLDESHAALQGPCWCPDHGGYHEERCERHQRLIKETKP